MTQRFDRPTTFGTVSFGDGVEPEPSASELLVGYGFRGWIAGYQTGDIKCWERVCRLYSNSMPPASARVIVGCLGSFAKAVNSASRRRVEVCALDECRFGRDECLVISMIAASQHKTCPAMRACTYALIDSSMMDEVLHHADTYAITLRALDHVISPNWIVNANAYVDPSPLRPH